MTDQTRTTRSIYVFLLVTLFISGCGGGGPSSETGNGFSPSSQPVGGGGVKGPMVNAVVSVYSIDPTQSDFKGERIATATTNARAAITGLALPFPFNPPYLLEFTSNGATIDLTTGQLPVITTVRSVITQEMLAAGKQIYATPLTAMAVDLAMANADAGDFPFTGNGDGYVSEAEFLAALPVAATQVASTVGFGLDSSVDIFDTPPIVNATTNTIEEQQAVAAYRAAVEALSAVVFEIHQQGLGDSPDAVLSELTADLTDGEIDGEANGLSSAIITSQALAVLASDPSGLAIPNSDDGYGNPIMVEEVNRLLSDETAETGSQVDTTPLSDGTIEISLQPATSHPDIDGDGTPNAGDAFPTNPTESVDTDGDGIGNNADNDDDNDGVSDGSDPDPQSPNEPGEAKEGSVDSTVSSSLTMSLTPEGSDPSLLQGATVSGNIYVSVSSDSDITKVLFYLDGTLVRTEKIPPYSFSGDKNGLINLFDTAQLEVGAHVISAEVMLSSGATEVLTANFTVESTDTEPTSEVNPNEEQNDPNGGNSSNDRSVCMTTECNASDIGNLGEYTNDGGAGGPGGVGSLPKGVGIAHGRPWDPDTYDRQYQEFVLKPGNEAHIKYWRVNIPWADVEPKKGQYDFSAFEDAIARVHPNILIIANIGTTNTKAKSEYPQWLRDAGYVFYSKRDNNYSLQTWRSQAKAYWLNLIKAFGERYGNHPRVVGMTFSEDSIGKAQRDDPTFSQAAFTQALQDQVATARFYFGVNKIVVQNLNGFNCERAKAVMDSTLSLPVPGFFGGPDVLMYRDLKENTETRCGFQKEHPADTSAVGSYLTHIGQEAADGNTQTWWRIDAGLSFHTSNSSDWEQAYAAGLPCTDGTSDGKVQMDGTPSWSNGQVFIRRTVGNETKKIYRTPDQVGCYLNKVLHTHVWFVKIYSSHWLKPEINQMIKDWDPALH